MTVASWLLYAVLLVGVSYLVVQTVRFIKVMRDRGRHG
jgi:hypothetical protein